MARDDLPGNLQPQQASNVRQAVQELQNAKDLGNTERVKAAEKNLRALGLDPTASGIKEAGRFLTDDRVKGRSQEQRDVTAAQADREAAADVSKIPGGGPDPDTPADRDEDQAGKLAGPGDTQAKARDKAAVGETDAAKAKTPRAREGGK